MYQVSLNYCVTVGVLLSVAASARRLYEHAGTPIDMNLLALKLRANKTVEVNPNRELGPIARVANNFNQATLPCCKDSIGQLACQGLRKYQASFFEKRCLNDHDFHTTLCCMECRNYIETHQIHPDNAKPIFKAPLMCKDKHSVSFCRKFKDHGIGRYSCKDAEFAMRTCRHSCGYCDDNLYDHAKTMPPCK